MADEAVFRALADPGRRHLLDMLHERSGLTLGELCAGLDMRRQSVSQHLGVLEESGLVTTVRDGNRRRHFLNPVPLREVGSRWIWTFEESRLEGLATVRARAEEAAMNQHDPSIPDYVYVTYIRATPEQVWEALTDAEISARYWGHAQVSAWEVGSAVEHTRIDGSGIVDGAGRVVEVDPPHRLVYGFDDPQRIDDPTFEPSLVTFTLEQGEGIVKLTLTQSRFSEHAHREGVSHGWPAVLANLKTYLETGDVLPQEPWEFHAEERDAQMAQHD